MSRTGIRAALSRDRSTVLLRGGTWKGDFPVSKLDAQLELYRTLRDRKDGACARFYKQTVEDLEKVKERLG
jgi:hypothetical protein